MLIPGIISKCVSCEVCILSHGENGSIICCNGEQVATEDILRRFNNREAPALRGKPKYFLFQSCRGLDIDYGVEVDGPHTDISR